MTTLILGALITILSILWAFQVQSYLGMAFFGEQFLAVVLGCVLCLTFLMHRARRGSDGPAQWYDLVLGFGSAATLFYIAYDWARFLEAFAYRPTDMIVLGAVVVLTVLEAVRRLTGAFLFGIVVAFFVYGLLGDRMPAPLTGRSVGLESLLVYLSFDSNAVLGVALTVSATVVVPFIFFGQLLFKSGGAAFFTDLAMAIMGRQRGGAAKISVFASALFGSISGSAVSNVATTGVMTIPLMRRAGYSSEKAGAIVAVASTGGQFMPPIMGAAAFLMAEYLVLPYTEVILAGLIPALLYYFAVFVQVDLMAAKERPVVVDDELPKAAAAFKEGWHFLLPFAVLLFALFALHEQPQIAALYAAIALIVGSSLRPYKGEQLRVSTALSAFWTTGHAMMGLLGIVAAAGIVIGVLNISSGGFALTLFLVDLGSEHLALLLPIGAFVCILLGMGMPTAAVYVLLAFLVAPSLVGAGVDRLAAHMFILYFGMMSMITPPIALAAFAAATITKADPVKTGWAAVRLGWVAYVVPFLFVVSPTLIMQGPASDIMVNVFSAVCGVYLVSVAAAGYFSRPLNWVYRFALAGMGLAAMNPASSFVFVSLGILVPGAALLGREYVIAGRARKEREG